MSRPRHNLRFSTTEAAAALSRARAGAELELLTAMLADPAVGVACARQHELDERAIEAEDLACLFAACLSVPPAAAAARERVQVLDERGIVLRVGRELLRAGGHWDDAAAAHEWTSGRWSDASLVACACHFCQPGGWCPSVAAVQVAAIARAAARVGEVRVALRDASEMFRGALTVLHEAVGRLRLTGFVTEVSDGRPRIERQRQQRTRQAGAQMAGAR